MLFLSENERVADLGCLFGICNE